MMADGRGASRVGQLRAPPQSVEAEQAVLGGLMLAPAVLAIVAECLAPTDFYRRDHQLIYRAIHELAEKGRPYDAVTLGEWFESHGLAEQVANGAYLVELASTTPSAANIAAYAEIVRDKSMLRQLIEVGTGIVNDAFQPDGRDSADILTDAQAGLGRMLQSQPAELEQPREVLKRVNARLMERFEAGAGAIAGLSTGFPELDRILCGLRGGQLVVLAARPKMGKTTLALNITQHVALEAGGRVALHSLEMSTDEVMERLLASVGEIPHEALRWADLEEEQWTRHTQAIRRLLGAGLVMSRPRNVRVHQLVAQTQREHAVSPLSLVVIDYLQLIDTSGAANQNLGISEITRQLKLMAGALNVPVLLLSQLNREAEKRQNKRPQGSDLRDSGSIEQDADVVLFLYRDEVYNAQSPDRGTAEAIVHYQRSGPPGMARLRCQLDQCRFLPLEHDWHPETVQASNEGRPRTPFQRMPAQVSRNPYGGSN